MEGYLFGVAIWCGIYAQIVRWLGKEEKWLESRWVLMLLNSVFWATFSAVGGMLIASYTDKMEQTWGYAVSVGVVGALIGAVRGWSQSRVPAKRDALLSDNLEWADTGFSAILLAATVMFFIVQAFKIPSGSMRMTFVEGDHLFVNKFIYGIPVPFTDKKILPLRKVKPGDIVIFRYPAKSKDDRNYGKDFIKRTVALAGQAVEVRDKKVYVDGVLRDEPFAQHVDPYVFPGLHSLDADSYQHAWENGDFADRVGNDVRDNFGPVKVPPGCILVMGDNRDRSFDARFWGPLKFTAIKGEAWLLYWPLNRFRVAK